MVDVTCRHCILGSSLASSVISVACRYRSKRSCRYMEPTAATSHTFVRATDSGLAAALYSIKKEPVQEPRAANRRVEQHAAATEVLRDGVHEEAGVDALVHHVHARRYAHTCRPVACDVAPLIQYNWQGRATLCTGNLEKFVPPLSRVVGFALA